MKKITAILLALLMLAGLLVGCAKDVPAPTESQRPAVTTEQKSTPTDTQPATTETPSTEAPTTEEPTTAIPTESEVATTEAPVPTETEAPAPTETEHLSENPPAPAGDNSELLKDYKWNDGVIVIDGVLYHTYTDPYMKFEENGWSFNLADYGKDDNYSLNSMEYVFSTIDLKSEKYGTGYSDPEITIGIINTDSSLKPIKQCMIHGIKVSGVNTFDTFENDPYNPKPCYDFELPQGIRRGSSLEEIKAVFGESEPTYVGDGDGYHYEKYQYKDEETKVTIELTVYDGYGLQEVGISNSSQWKR